MKIGEIRLANKLIDAKVHQMRNAVRQRFQHQETEIRNLLHRTTTPEGVVATVQQALSGLGIGGVNVYRFSNESTRLYSVGREELQGASRYSQPQILLPGEKMHFIESGAKRGFPEKTTDIMIVDRLNLWGFSPENEAAAKAEFESDLVKYFGEDYQVRYADRLDLLKEALRFNLYVRYPAFDSYDMLIMANLHVRNAELVKKGEAPVTLLGQEIHRDLVFETLGNLQPAITSELTKVELMRRHGLQLTRTKDTHDLQIALDTIEDPIDLFEMLLDDLPRHFVRGTESRVERSSVMLLDNNEGLLKIVSSRGLTEEIVKNTRVIPGQGISGRVFLDGTSLLEKDATETDTIKERRDPLKIAEGSFMSVPIKFESHIFGVLNVRSRTKRSFKIKDLEHFELLASILATKLHLMNLRNMDGLTELYMREPGKNKLNKLIEQAQNDRTPLSFILLDIDHFKKVNDTYGHEAGDMVLIGVANAIRLFTHKYREEFIDSVEIRWGGEEMVLAIKGANRERALQLAEELRENIKELQLAYFGEELNISASFGVAVFPMNGKTIDDLARSADTALYRSKEGGRDRVTMI